MEVVSFEDLDLYGVPVQALSADSFRFDVYDLVEGRRLHALDRKKIMLGKIVAQNLGKTVGDVVEVVEDEPYEVIGIFESFPKNCISGFQPFRELNVGFVHEYQKSIGTYKYL